MHFPRRHTHNPNIFFSSFFFSQSEFMYLARVSPSPLFSFCDDKRLRLARDRRSDATQILNHDIRYTHKREAQISTI